MREYRGVIFDLDDTLFPVSSLPPELLGPACEAARVANVGAGAVSTERLERALADARRRPFLRVAQIHGLPEQVISAWRAVHRSIVVSGPLTPFEDVVPVLTAMPQRRFLVTTGFRCFQQSKLAALGVADLFEKIYIDAVDEPALHVGKLDTFRRVLEDSGLAAHEVIVVGDDAESELAAGRALGMVTVQVLRPGIAAAEDVDHRITSFYDLPRSV
jgi:putative hydrolase of the HAD superfamily